jgi:hypothetical protein
MTGTTVDKVGPGRAMRVAHVLQGRDGDKFAKPGKLVEVHFVRGQTLSLAASRLLALMILRAGGDAWEPILHRMKKADIRRGHKSNERIGEMLEELHRTLFSVDDLSWRGRRATRRFALIQSSREEAEDDNASDSGWIEWEFTPAARDLICQSETYAVLNRQAVLGFRSSYALKLYEIGALRLHRRQSSWRADIIAIRAMFGIAPEHYKDFAQLRRKVLDKAKAEVDQLAHFTVEWREIKRGRAVAEVVFAFYPKDGAPQHSAAVENDRDSAGRDVRRGGSTERVVEPPLPLPSSAGPASVTLASNYTFPTGSLRFAPGPFGAIAIEHGGGWDRDVIADAYRSQMGERLLKLTGVKLIKSWIGFCQAFAARRGRP